MLTGNYLGAPFDKSKFGFSSFYARKRARTRGLDLFESFNMGVIHKTKHFTNTSRTHALPVTENVQSLFSLGVCTLHCATIRTLEAECHGLNYRENCCFN